MARKSLGHCRPRGPTFGERHCLAIMVVVVADEPESIDDLVARIIREKLQQGRLDELFEVTQMTLLNPNALRGPKPEPVEQFIRPAGIPSAEVVSEPVIKADATVIPAEVVDAIRTASPELADEIQTRNPQDATQVINLFIALINLLAALLALYMAQHPAAPVTPQQVIQIFDQSRHVVNQTIVVNPPPPHGAG